MPFSTFSSQHTPLNRIFSTSVAAVVSSGLICHLKTAPPTGSTWTDDVGNSNATLANSPTYSSSDGGYISLNGSNQYVMTSTSLNAQISGTSPNKSTAQSIFIWCYPTEQGVIVSEIGQPTINTAWHDSNIEMSSGGLISFSVWHGSMVNRVTSTSRSFNAWYNLGWTYSGTTLTAYINGTSVGTATLTRQAPFNNGFNLHYALGATDATNMGEGSYCAMRVGSFQVYNRALTAGEVATNFNSNRTIYGLLEEAI
jgi:hypothetical protein